MRISLSTVGAKREMKIIGPERYKLNFSPTSFSVTCENGTNHFSGISTSKKPKIYVVTVDEKPIYVGVTKQPMRNRLRFGWNAEGEGGYYGYAWRHDLTEAILDVWCHDNASNERPMLDVETVEAEIVYLIRAAGQWPMHQTEIHFHPSTQMHRNVAEQITGRYSLTPGTA
jgi:hypothetical protein